MWPVDLQSEVAIRRAKLLREAPPRRARGERHLRARIGVSLVRLGMVVAGGRAWELPVDPAPCR